MRFPGVIPAVVTPFDEHGHVDVEALAANARRLLEEGCTGLVGTGTMGEAQSLSDSERRLVIETLAGVAGGRVMVTAGVSGPTAATAIDYAADAVAAGAGAIMLLPPLGYGGDPRELETFYRTVAGAAGLPLMVYNNPKSSGVDMPPALIARLAEIDHVIAVKECSGDARRIAELVNGTELEVLVGGDDWALEGFCAGAGGWISGVANVAPRDCVELLELCDTGRLAEAREVYARVLPLARLDMKPKLVQYFKAAMDLVGRHGGPSRPPRLELTAAERAEVEEAMARTRGARPRVIASRVLAAVDSHTEGMPTRVITGGVAPLPGATMLERKLWFERHMDELRLLLMREPRGHGAMSGAILQPPLRADADWGVLFIEVSGCLPMCGHGTIGVATVLVETGMVEVREPETVVRLDTPAGLVEARVQVEGGRALAVSLRNVPSFLLGRDRQVVIGGRSVTYDIAFGGNFYALLPAAEAGVVVDPARADELIARGLELMTAIDLTERPVHPLDERIGGCRHVVFFEPAGSRGQRSATAIHPGWLDRSPCGTGTSARLAQLHARGALGVGEEFVNESVIGTRFSGRIVDETVVGELPAVVCEISGRAWITGMGQYMLAPDDPFPAGFAL